MKSLRLLHPQVEVGLHADAASPALDQRLVDEAGAIACEALRNAFTHAQARRIVVTIGHDKRALSVVVEDDGRGITHDVADAGRREGRWCLVGMRERAARIGSQLELRSDASNGTAVKLSVPLPKTAA